MLPDFHEILMDTFRPFVMKGAAWLDEYEPGWASKIVPEELDISSGDLCICGQMFGTYNHRPSVVGNAAAYGFTIPDYDDFVQKIRGEGNRWAFWNGMYSRDRCWAALDRLWLSEIYWRLDPDGKLGKATAF